MHGGRTPPPPSCKTILSCMRRPLLPPPGMQVQDPDFQTSDLSADTRQLSTPIITALTLVRTRQNVCKVRRACNVWQAFKLCRRARCKVCMQDRQSSQGMQGVQSKVCEVCQLCKKCVVCKVCKVRKSRIFAYLHLALACPPPTPPPYARRF